MWLFADDHATFTRTQAPLYSRAGGDIAYTPLRTENHSTFPQGGGGVHTLWQRAYHIHSTFAQGMWGVFEGTLASLLSDQ